MRRKRLAARILSVFVAVSCISANSGALMAMAAEDAGSEAEVPESEVPEGEVQESNVQESVVSENFDSRPQETDRIEDVNRKDGKGGEEA